MQTVLVSALTAAAVTLLIEFAAKPHLEARKERILDSYRFRRDLISRIDLLVQNFPPILGVETVIQDEHGAKVVDKFIDDSHEVFSGALRHDSTFGKRQRACAQLLRGELYAALRVCRTLLAQYQSSADVEFRKFVNNEIGLRVKSALCNALLFRGLLIISWRRPWRYYKFTRRVLRNALPRNKSSPGASHET
jgi:hypothetical protein